jgi:aspartyl-tRNA(Asn)/glutamyl-tRNA(Gln) amidotransferase subunit A
MSVGESVRATEHYLGVIERLNPKLNAILTVTADLALQQAQAADKAAAEGDWLGILHGVPMTVKDCLQVAGIRTTYGSIMFKDYISNTDSEVVRRIRRSGPVFLGKTNLPEFCYGATTHNVHYGNCVNPWDIARIPGGSSGGAAASLAAGMSRIAFGSDTGGSVRCPSALCGVSGIRPTVGRVPNSNALALTIHADTIGMMARSVADVARGFAAIAGYDPDDVQSEDVAVDNFLPTLRDGIEGTTIGIPKTFFYENCEPDIVKRVQEATKVLESCGARLVDIDIHGTEEARIAAGPTILAIDMTDEHRENLEKNPEKYGPEVLRRLRAGEPFKGTDYAKALRIVERWKHQFKAVFRDVDIIATPTTPIVAPKFADSEDLQKATHGIMRNLVGFSYAGVPCLSVPVGFDRQGMPVGMQLTGKWFNEPLLFRAGVAYQSRTEFHKAKPPISG